MKGWSIFVALGSSILMQSAVNAQLTGSRIGADASAKDGVKELRILAECFVDKRSASAAHILHALPGPADYAQINAELATLEICTGNDKLVMAGKQIAFKPAVLRRPIAVAMVRRMLRHAEVPTSLPASTPQPWYQAQLLLQPKDFAVNEKALIAEDFGHCLALKQWKDAVALVRSEPATDEERTAFHAMIPSLGQCVSAGQTTKITADMIRDTVAEPIYHIAADRGSGGNH